MKMKIINGFTLRTMFAKQKHWRTVRQVAEGLEMSTRTVNKLFQEQNVNQATIIKVAEVLEIDDPLTIAKFVD